MCIACVARNIERVLQVCDVQVFGMNCMVSYLFRRALPYRILYTGSHNMERVLQVCDV